MLDQGGVARTMGVTTDVSGNCYANIAIVDGSTAANKMAVKPASTAPAATDPSAVVAQSPNTAVTPGDALSNTQSTQPVISFIVGWDATNLVWRRLQVDAGTGTLKVDPGTVTVTGSVNIGNSPTVNQGGAPWQVNGATTASDSLANPTTGVPGISFAMGWDATNTVWRRIQVDAGTGTVKVDPGTVTVTGTVSISGTVTVAGTVTTTPPSNASTNITQINGVTITTGTGPSGTGAMRVTVSNDSELQLWDGTTGPVKVQPASTTPAPADLGLTVTQSPNALGCAGQSIANTIVKPFDNNASSSNLLLVTGTASKKIYICAINIGPVGAAVNVALVEGTTTTNPCDTGTAGMASGGATAARGWIMAANEGITYGNGVGILFKEATAADNVCLFFSAAVQVSGVITYIVGS